MADKYSSVLLWSLISPNVRLYRRLCEKFGCAAEVFKNASRLDELEPKLRPAIAERIKKNAGINTEQIRLRLEQLNIQALYEEEDSYPEYFRVLDDMPPVLFAKGDVSLLEAERRLTVVGTRSNTEYGERIAKSWGESLGRAGVTVVSGMALGIDALAQSACMDAGGKTIAVLGCGVNVIYPMGNEALYHRIEKDGLLISEITPGQRANKGYFPLRNRLMSAIGQAALVIEGNLKSGTRHTVDYALGYSREVFAVPGSIYSQRSELTNHLIKNGANVATCVQDIMESMGWDERRQMPVEWAPQNLIQSMIHSRLEKEDLSLSQLAEFTGCDISELLMELTMMQMEGQVQRLGGDVYSINRG